MATVKHGTAKLFVFKDLKAVSHVFVHRGASKAALDPLYEGLYPLRVRQELNFKVDIKGVTKTVSLNRLKPA